MTFLKLSFLAIATMRRLKLSPLAIAAMRY